MAQQQEPNQPAEAGEQQGLVRTLNLIRLIYGIFFILAALLFILAWFAGNQYPLWSFDGLLNIVVLGFIFVGLGRRRPWTLPLTQIYAAYSCVFSILNFFTDPVNINPLLYRGVFLFSFAFYGYQLVYFLRPEVRAKFKTRGHHLL